MKGEKMKLMIAGSRDIIKFNLAPFIPRGVDVIITGGADGIDAIAEKYADDHRISKYILRPRYDLYGRAAPLKRNEQMVDLSDRLLIVWDGASKGTLHTIKYAKSHQKDMTLIIVNEDDKKL